MFMRKLFATMPVLLLLSVVFISGCATDDSGSEITSFEECAEAGYAVMESYPRQCRTPDGQLFVEEIEGTPIGGERDEHGCLGAAGYTWDGDVGACIRTWELDEGQKTAAGIAVEYVGWEYATTVVEVLTARCPGCFMVKLEQGEQRDAVTVNVNNWTASGKTVTRHKCTAEEKAAEICTMEYAPVCGWSELGVSKTYGNACQACAAGIEYWETGECATEGMSPQECIDMGGRTVNTVGGQTCEENESNAGSVQGFISPNICCVPE